MNFKGLLKQNGFEITEYYEKYLKVAELLGFDDVVKCIPFDLETLKNSYAKDPYFNNHLTPIKKWDSASGFYCKGADCFYIGSDLTRLYSKAGVTYFSNSDGVSLLKTVAKKLVLDALRGEKEMNVLTCNGTYHINTEKRITLEAHFDSRGTFCGKASYSKENNVIMLFSNNTPVLFKDSKDNLYINADIKESSLLSNTTLRHIKEFIKQFCNRATPTKQEIKDFYDFHIEVNC